MRVSCLTFMGFLVIRNDAGPVGEYITRRLSQILSSLGVAAEAVDARLGLPTQARDPMGIVVGGSLDGVNDGHAWSAREEAYLREVVARRVPVLGVCFGHQILAKALGGRVEKRSLVGGNRQVNVTHDSPIFEGVTDLRFNVSHQDQVVKLPPTLIRTATSDYCDIQAFQHVERPVFGVQFHPCYDKDVLAVDELACVRPTFRENEQGFLIFKNFVEFAVIRARTGPRAAAQ